MGEKMTAEHLATLLASLGDYTREDIKSHISALEAEVMEERNHKEGYRLDAEGMRERIAALETERDEWKTEAEMKQAALTGVSRALDDLVSEHDALREQVYGQASRLAAIRQRAWDEDGLGLAYAKSYSDRGDGAHRGGLCGVARYILGKDAPVQVAKAEPPESTPAQQDWDGQHPHDAPEEDDPAKEPSTAGAFETVREGLRRQSSRVDVVEDEGALSLLERRMGAMERALASIAKNTSEPSTKEVARAALRAK
jgi:hypothetical protein